MLMMRRVAFCAVALLITVSFSYAQEEVKATKEYIPLAKGNFWEYKITGEVREEGNCKLEIVEEIGKDRFRVNPTGKGYGLILPGLAEFCVEGDYFWWKTPDGPASVALRMLKLGAKKGDSWTTSVNLPASVNVPSILWNSTIVGVEDVSTPAGVFKECLKVVQLVTLGRDVTSENLWFAKGIGLVKFTTGSPEGDVMATLTLTKYKIVTLQEPEQISKWLSESETALLVEVTSVTDVKPEKEGEAVTKVKVAAKVEKALKGESSETELALELPVDSIKVGKYVLFFKKGEKGDMIVGEPVPATKEDLKVIDEILNPPQFADTISSASLVIAGKVVTCEDRATFKYYAVEIIKTFKGEKKEYIDVYRTEELDLENGKIYIFALKTTVVSGRNYFEPAARRGAVVIHTEELEKQIEDTLKGQKEK